MSDLEALSGYRRDYYTKLKEIESMYDTRRAIVASREPRSRKSTRSDPVSAAVYRIEAEREELREIYRVYAEAYTEAEKWAESIPDPAIRCIIRAKFFLSKDWKQTERELYGSAAAEGSRARNYFWRYCRKYGILEDIQ